MSTPLFTLHPEGSHTRVQLERDGLLEVKEIEELHTGLHQLLDENKSIILDLRQSDFMSSQLLGIILTSAIKLQKTDRPKLIVCAAERVIEVLAITRLDGQVQVIRSPDELRDVQQE